MSLLWFQAHENLVSFNVDKKDITTSLNKLWHRKKIRKYIPQTNQKNKTQQYISFHQLQNEYLVNFERTYLIYPWLMLRAIWERWKMAANTLEWAPAALTQGPGASSKNTTFQVTALIHILWPNPTTYLLWILTG